MTDAEPRFVLNEYGRQCFDLGYEAAKANFQHLLAAQAAQLETVRQENEELIKENNEFRDELLARVAALEAGAAPTGSTAASPEPSPSLPSGPEKPRVKFLTCKRCGCRIDIDLCGYGCDLDNTPIPERLAADMEVRVYEFVGAEPPSHK